MIDRKIRKILVDFRVYDIIKFPGNCKKDSLSPFGEGLPYRRKQA